MVKYKCNICGGTGIDERTYPSTECTCSHLKNEEEDTYEHNFDLEFREKRR